MHASKSKLGAWAATGIELFGRLSRIMICRFLDPFKVLHHCATAAILHAWVCESDGADTGIGDTQSPTRRIKTAACIGYEVEHEERRR